MPFFSYLWRDVCARRGGGRQKEGNHTPGCPAEPQCPAQCFTHNSTQAFAQFCLSLFISRPVQVKPKERVQLRGGANAYFTRPLGGPLPHAEPRRPSPALSCRAQLPASGQLSCGGSGFAIVASPARESPFHLKLLAHLPLPLLLCSVASG